MTHPSVTSRAHTLVTRSTVVSVTGATVVNAGAPCVTGQTPQYGQVKHLLNGMPLGHQKFRPLARLDAGPAPDGSADLSIGQAADALGTSVAFLTRQIDAGELPARGAGSDRRIGAADLARYRQEVYDRRSRALDELSTLSQELGLP